MPSIAHVAAAVLLSASIAASVSGISATAKAPAPACMTKAQVAKRVGDAKPRFDLKDEELAAFNANYKQLMGKSPPESVDEILVWGEGETEGHTLLFVAFSKGCVVFASFIEADEFLTIYNGHRA